MMKKGQSMELVELTVLVVAISIMLIISYFMLTTRTPEIKGLVTEEHIYTSLGDTVISFYNTKISGTKRTLAQLLADRITGNSENIYYGEGVGIINVDKQVTEFFDSYLDEKWNLTSETLTHQLSFGHETPKDINRKITYKIIIPRPSLSSDVIILNLDTWLE